MKRYLWLLMIVQTAWAQSTAVEKFLDYKGIQQATVAVQIYDIANHKLLANYNAQKLLQPASLQKIVTSQKALAILGEDFCFETKIELFGTLAESKFKGILKITASADPTLNENFVAEIIAFFKEKNIKHFEGKIQVDESFFDADFPKSWLVEDVANYYATPAYAFNYKQNTYRLTFQQSEKGKSPQIIAVKPKMEHLIFENKVISAGENTKDNAYILGSPFANKRQIVGTIPAGKNTFSIKGADNNPSATFKNDLAMAFQQNQIIFEKNERVEAQKKLYQWVHYSQKLPQLLRYMNTYSRNLYAESILKAIGKKVYDKGTTQNGLKALQLSEENIKVLDGSGLSYKNALTAHFLLTILKAKYQDNSFVNSLAISAKKGTLRYFKSEAMQGNLKGKSGSAEAILNYAGYFKTAEGKPIAFVLMVNHYTGSKYTLRKEMLQLLEAFY